MPPVNRRGLRIALYAGVAFAALVLSGAGAWLIFSSAINSAARSKAQALLEDRFQGRAHFEQLQVSVFPSFHLTGKGLVLQREGDDGLPPLLEIATVEAESPAITLIRGHVRSVKLSGLVLNVPLGSRGSRDPSAGSRKHHAFPVVIDRLECRQAHLSMLRNKSEKPPLEFEIHDLQMKHVDLDKPAEFQASLTNPEPPGEIRTTGRFGPWNAEEPSQTPVSGTYVFSRADLSSFHGIGGILSSTGKFDGRLRRIEVDGTTDTPDFLLAVSRHPIPLRTTFHAVVDGTNGNSWLQPVRGMLRNTPILTRGQITKVQDAHGRRILLDGVVEGGRLEDVLELAVQSSPPPMSGLINLHTKIDLPPGPEDVIRKLKLDGSFEIESARFASLDIRERLRSLSRKAKGMPEDESAGSAVSNLRGNFQLKDAVANFSKLTFQLDGATLQLTGRYEIEGERLDFHGKLLMDAKLSQTTTGVKAFFLKALDPLFHRSKGGSEIPIRISGTRSNPSFSLAP